MPELRQFGAHIPLRFGPDGKSGFGGGDILRGGVEQIRRQARRSGQRPEALDGLCDSIRMGLGGGDA